MENTRTHTLNPTPTFELKEVKTNRISYMGHPENEASTFARKTHRRKRTRDSIKAVHQQMKVHDLSRGSGGGGDDDDQNKEELERKIVALQRIVPGGETLGVDKLFEETADYILALQCQIKAMKVLTNFIEALERKKRKFGA